MKTLFSTIFSLLLTVITAQTVVLDKAHDFIKAGKYDKALTQLEKALQDEQLERVGRTHYLLGKVRRYQFEETVSDVNLEKMLAAFRRGLDLVQSNSPYKDLINSELYEVYNSILQKAGRHYQNKQYEDAGDLFEMAQLYENDDTTTVMYAGYARYSAGQKEKALDNFYRLVDMKGFRGLEGTYGYIIALEQQVNGNEAALEATRKARRKLRKSLEIRKIEINLLLGLGKVEEGLNDTEKALKRDPDDPVLHFVKGALLAGKGDREGAKASYELAVTKYEAAGELKNAANVKAELESLQE